ncbi:hypothetical protein TPL01_31120 [Sulfuriferula plumbiphila]|uniref:Thioredoxin-like fold domain-containing protein n=1 Tax=Sulfuriferula plumbiphila TaxID=171865 RepID=A0A512LBW2_9PROT|nr:thioredoxin fold domain-containing protein [Sulfuriferula plumbiphila]BBP05420.1 hypothetical protein SFPGR_28420 [Sulfuriferula plumbiphila]GEP31974.1 hypothetical protein TPL01_31120 [Sulfuriferula plumbiphila]
MNTLIRHSLAIFIAFFLGLSPSWAANADAARAETLLTSLHAAKWIQEGAGPRIVYIFFDPNCPYCHKLYQATRKFVGKEGLEFRWIPVGFLSQSSLGKAAAILAAKDRRKAFHTNEDDYGFGAGPGGGIPPLSHPGGPVLRALNTNLSLMHQARLWGIPVMAFRARDGQAQLMVGSLPPDKLGEMLRLVK